MFYLIPWYPIDDPAEAAGLAAQLQREVPPRHQLYGIAVRAIARRQDGDDVLFELLDDTGRVAVVHLTWARSQERYPWPSTRLFASLVNWATDGMSADHVEFEA